MAENNYSSTSSDSDIDEDTLYDSDSDYSDKYTCYLKEPEYTEEEMQCMRKTTDKNVDDDGASCREDDKDSSRLENICRQENDLHFLSS